MADRALEPGPGTRLNDNVELVELVAKGGMGSVWRAHHRGLAADVAVKLIAGDLCQSEEGRGRFLREARAAASIRSPHVIKLYDCDVYQDRPFIVMELLRGRTLEERMCDAPLALDEVCAIVDQTARALAAAHEAGVVHRDIKPGNIFLVEGRRINVKLLDFGIAKILRSSPGSFTTGAGASVGTPEYMSPEQLLEPDKVDRRADIWALAVLAYEMLTGECAFSGANPAALIIAITKIDYRPPSRLNPDLARFDGWFRTALARDPADRFGDVKSAARELLATAGR